MTKYFNQIIENAWPGQARKARGLGQGRYHSLTYAYSADEVRFYFSLMGMLLDVARWRIADSLFRPDRSRWELHGSFATWPRWGVMDQGRS